MQRIPLLFLLLSANFHFSFSQNSSCDGSRYIDDQFNVDTTLGIVFGNSTTIGGYNADLLLDFFEPTADAAPERPLIILAFGGSFISGAREDLHPMCQYYAQKGYACATIDYRLYDGTLFPVPDSTVMVEEVIMTMSDMRAAIRFFREDAATANNYRIDTNLIFVGGVSAGGIVASHAAFLDDTDPVYPYVASIIASNGGYSGNSSTNTQYGDQVSGVLNFSGALKDASYIDGNDPNLFSVHDDGDNVVPYGAGMASVMGVPIVSVEGSSVMHAQAQSVGVPSELITIPSSTGHVSYFNDAAGVDSILQRSIEFLFPIVCPQYASEEELDKSEFKVYPNPVRDLLIVDGVQDAFAVRLIDNAGRVVHTNESEGNTMTIDTSGLPSGVYILEIVVEGKFSEKRKIVVD